MPSQVLIFGADKDSKDQAEGGATPPHQDEGIKKSLCQNLRGWKSLANQLLVYLKGRNKNALGHGFQDIAAVQAEKPEKMDQKNKEDAAWQGILHLREHSLEKAGYDDLQIRNTKKMS